MSDDILAIDRMFVTCWKCGKIDDWVIEFSACKDDFWYQPKMTCGECYYSKEVKEKQ